MSDVQFDLFGRSAPLPEEFIYQPALISEDEENECAEQIRQLAFEKFEFRGYHGKRRTISFGFLYDFSGGGLRQSDPIPPFLLTLRDRAARNGGLAAASLAHALVTEYTPGAGIGWHRDRPVFGEVIGI